MVRPETSRSPTDLGERLVLEHRSALVMIGLQKNAKHRLPKTARKGVGLRINLTWRPYRKV